MDTLYVWLHADYLSDLRYDRDIRRIVPLALAIRPNARFSVQEWSRALGYLYGDGGLDFATVAEAKQFVETHPLPHIFPDGGSRATTQARWMD